VDTPAICSHVSPNFDASTPAKAGHSGLGCVRGKSGSA